MGLKVRFHFLRHVGETAARRGYLSSEDGECVASAARLQRLFRRHTPTTPQRVSLITIPPNTHTHTRRNSANAHKTLIEHLNVNLTFFRGGKKQLGARMFRCFSPSSLPSSRPDQGSFILRKISVIGSSAHLSTGANVKDGEAGGWGEKRRGRERDGGREMTEERGGLSEIRR